MSRPDVQGGKWKRRSAWLTASIGLHALLGFLAMWLGADANKKTPLPPIALRIVKPVVPVAVPQAEVPVIKTERMRAWQRAPDATNAESAAPVARRETRGLSAQSFAPRVVKDGGAIVMSLGKANGAERGIAALAQREQPFGDDGLTPKQRAEGLLNQDLDAFITRQHTSHGARGSAAALRTALRERFTPAPGFVDKIPGSAEAAKKFFQNAVDAHNRPSTVAHTQNNLQPSQKEIEQGLLKSDPCAQSHEIGRRECRFRVEHDAAGQVSAYQLMLSSGDPAFDAYAQDVLKRSQVTHLTRHPEEPHPLFSEWALAQVVYDWASTPSCYDPDFRPPGSPVYPDRKNPYAITFTAEVSLLAVRYGK